MKKFALVALFALAVFGSAFAVVGGPGKDGELSIQGTLNARAELYLPGAFKSEIIDTAGFVNSWDLGTITVNTNFKNWKFYISSTNAGSLVLSGDDSEKIPYVIHMVRKDDGAKVFSDTALAKPVLSDAQPRTPKAGLDYELVLEFAADETSQWQNGVYADTLYLSISTN
ncbi:MAG: hypothetical protein LWX00_07390 [Spirochaetia bacterium]|nr:hypothetical protein [Spirochaetia bacterium]